jgi:hypothetical protein
MKTTILGRLLGAASLSSVLLLVAATSALAAPALEMHISGPDAVTPERVARVLVVIQNTGDEPLSGELTLVSSFAEGLAPANPDTPGMSCQLVDQTNTCTLDVSGVRPGAQIYGNIYTLVRPDATGTLVSTVEVSGGGTTDAISSQVTMTVGPPPPFGIKGFEAVVGAGSAWSSRQAGSNPAAVKTSLAFPTVAATLLRFFPITAPVEQFKDVTVHVPAGLIGKPTATPVRCTLAQLSDIAPDSPHSEIPDCPVSSQVGVVRLANSDLVPLYNVVPPRGAPAAFGFQYQSVPTVLVARLRPSDHGIDIVARKAASSVPIAAVEVTFWGIPADSSHDPLRGVCLDGYQGNNGNLCPSGAPRAPFLRLPTSCLGSPMSWAVDATSYVHPTEVVHGETTSPGMEGCQSNPFEPTLSLTPTDHVPHGPTGVDATLSLPQDVGPNGLAQADVRRATVALPSGMSINPSSAGGLQACSDADTRLEQEGAASCPDASKLGTVTLTTPLLDHPIGGSIFLRTQNSDDPLSGEMFRIAVEIRSDDDGVFIRLPGAIKADPTTGQLTAVFDDLPQLPFSSMRLRFKDGSRAPLVNPSECGVHTASAVLTAWSGKVVPVQSSFEVSGCSGSHRFDPHVVAGLVNPVAASSSTFALRIERGDADGELKTVSTKLPQGLLANLAGVQVCTDAQASANGCPAATRVGRVQVGAGAGSNPFYITNGKVFLTEGYKGAPYGLLVKVPAVAGPFDLGDVSLRAALRIDPVTAQVTVESDPMPRILGGVPLKVRDVRVIVDRPGFIRSPTSCRKTSIDTTLGSYSGQTAKVATRFQLGSCSDLRFTPKLALRLTGAKQTVTGKHPGVRAKVTQAKGQAAIAKAVVRLPKSLALDPDNAKALCEFADGTKRDLENHCPKGSIVGRAKAITPLLDKPLAGDVYFVKNLKRSRSGNLIRTLPMLVVALRGEISINLKGTSDSARDGRLVNSFASVPDAPISKFNLNIKGGRSGILTVTRTARSRIDLCKGRHTAAVKMAGHNGKRRSFDTRVKAPCANRGVR